VKPHYAPAMIRTRPFKLVLFVLALMLASPLATAAQVATLATPDPDADSSAAPAEEIDGEQAILDFVSCLRDNGLDIPDPQFGPEGPRFADPAVMASIDFRSSEFLDAMTACEELLAALQPEIDPEQQAEQNEQLLEFAVCMRGEGIDFPDPDPVRGLTIGSMRGADGELVVDVFSPAFQRASEVCSAEIGLEPAGPGTS
jgi:hypothetical protein